MGSTAKWYTVRRGNKRATKRQSRLLSRYVHLHLPFLQMSHAQWLYGKEEERIYLSGSFFSLVSHLVKFTPCELIPLYFQIALCSSLVGCPLGIPDPTPCGVVFHHWKWWKETNSGNWLVGPVAGIARRGSQSLCLIQFSIYLLLNASPALICPSKSPLNSQTHQGFCQFPLPGALPLDPPDLSGTGC